MSLTVRCPACDAQFRTYVDQLRVAHGWVRCGRCQQSFDAAAAQLSPSRADSSAGRSPLLQRVSGDSDKRVPIAANATMAMPRESLVQRAAHDRRLPTRSERPPVATPTTTPAFLREASTPSSPDRGGAGWRAFSGLVAILLVLLLLAQVLLQQRDWLAARAPAAAPMLGRACAMLGCTIAPPREIDALVISNSSLTKVGADGYRLSLAVKNRSDLRLAMPGIELSLLDRAERTVLRRVLMAHDVGAGDALEPFGEWAGTVQFELPDRTVQVAGYRMLAFYP